MCRREPVTSTTSDERKHLGSRVTGSWGSGATTRQGQSGCSRRRCPKQGDAVSLLSVEKYYFRGAEGYETARRATVWNGLLPDRFPDVIVQAHDTDDVVAAIRYARANGHQVGVRSGGHSWAASHLRDGGLLLDVSRLDHGTVDTGSDDRGRRAGQDRQRLCGRTRLAGAVLSHRPLRRDSPRRLSAAGRVRLEQQGGRTGM